MILKSPSNLSFLLSLLVLFTNVSSANEAKLKVVTSFSILEDLVVNLGGEHVSVVNLVGRNSDAHMYQPKPSDAVAISNADLVVLNGMGFEGWIARLIENSRYENELLLATEGVKAIKNGNEVDPHAWQSFQNIRVYVDNITLTLIALRPDHGETFKRRQQSYIEQLDRLESRLTKQMAIIPPSKRTVVTSHDAFGYLAADFDIQFYAPLGLSLEDQASAEDVAGLINQIREQKIQALFVENISNPNLLKRIGSETGVAVGGRLYSDALSENEGPAETYLKMMQHNVESLISAFHGN